MADENIALVYFKRGYALDGMSKDGMPAYRPVIKIHKEVGAHTKVDYVATEEDFEQFKEEYGLFVKAEKANATPVSSDGYPLSLWPSCPPHILQMCSARGITTVEQLAKIAKKRDAPGEITELAERAAQMLEHQKNVGKFEAIIRQKDGELSVLLEQIRELRGIVAGRDAIINSLRQMMPMPGGTVHG
jgi:hypothetical protein